MMKLFLTLAVTMLAVVAGQDKPEFYIHSQEYRLTYNPGYGEPVADTNMKFCVMEEHKGEQPTLPDKFQDQSKALGMWITDRRTALEAVPNTMESLPCWDRKNIGNDKKECGSWHIDASRNGVYRVHWCQ